MFLPRLCSSVVLLSLFGAIIFLNNFFGYLLFSLMVLFLTFFVTKEFCALIQNIGIEVYDNFLCIINSVVTALFLGVLFIKNELWSSFLPGLAVLLIPVCILASLLFLKNSEERLKKVFFTVGAFFFILVPIIMILGIYIFGMNSKWNLLFLFFILATKIGDIGAYVTGTLSNKILNGGNHKMIPSISPGKSYEGAAGGLLFTILLCLFFHFYTGLILTVWAAVMTGILFFFGGMAGDLAESSIKRACKIKDSGKTIPGIGGIFDLVDSPMMTAPIFYLILFFQIYFELEIFKI